MNVNVKYRVGKSKVDSGADRLFCFPDYPTSDPHYYLYIQRRDNKNQLGISYENSKTGGETGGGIVNALIGSIIIVADCHRYCHSDRYYVWHLFK